MSPSESAPDPCSESGKETGAGLYIHVPFCSSVCPYCDFAVTIAGGERRAAWARGVLREAATYGGCGVEFDTVYFGGGTPSSLEARSFSDVVIGLRQRLPIRDDAWIHVEINPEDVTPGNLECWLDLGVRFVSLGVQSFDDGDLVFLGRRHTGHRAADATAALLGAGFGTVSVDLIYGLPGQRVGRWLDQLGRALALGVHHMSCYQLTIHEGTVFGRRQARGRMSELPNDQQADLFFRTHETLADAGMPAYEVSNFARSGHRSPHNTKYWDHTPYLGLGPSAHSWIDGERRWNISKVRLWQRWIDSGRAPVEGRERPTPSQLALEALMLGLRTSDGVDVERVRECFGIDLRAGNLETIHTFQETGRLTVDGSVIRPTLSGMAIADSLVRAFEIPGLPDEKRPVPVR